MMLCNRSHERPYSYGRPSYYELPANKEATRRLQLVANERSWLVRLATSRNKGPVRPSLP